MPGTDIYYSIQGNILRPGEVVPNAVKAFLNDQRRDHRSRDGGDGSGRRVRRRQPLQCPPRPTDGSTPAFPCDGKTAHVAYILMAEPSDTNGDSHNNGKYSMYITVAQPGADRGAGAIKPGENLNPVKTLRVRYDAWRKAQPANFK